MAALWWRNSQRQLGEGQGVESFHRFQANILAQKGFTNTHGNEFEAAGGKNGCWVSVGHFHIGNSLYWEVIMGSADDVKTAEATVNEAAAAFQGIGSL